MAHRVLLPAYIALIPWMSFRTPFNIQLADLAFVAMALGFVWSGAARRISIGWLELVVLAYLGGLAVSLIDAPSAAGTADLVKSASVVAAYFIVATMARDDETRRRAISWFAWVTVALGALGLCYLASFALFRFSPEPWGRAMQVPALGQVLRLSLGFLTPELFGEFLTAALPFVLWYFLVRADRMSAAKSTFAILAVTLVEVFTFSHSWAGFLVAGLVFCWNQWRSPLWRTLRVAMATAACALVVVVNALSVAYIQRVDVEHRRVPAASLAVPEQVLESATWPQLQVTATYNYLYYFVLKGIAWRTFTEHPINGAGLGQFSEATERAFREGRLGSVCRACAPHSTLLGHLAETGLVGTAGLAALWIAPFVARRRLAATACHSDCQSIVRASTAAFAGLLVNSLNADVMHFRFLWLVLALTSGCLRGNVKARPATSA